MPVEARGGSRRDRFDQPRHDVHAADLVHHAAPRMLLGGHPPVRGLAFYRQEDARSDQDSEEVITMAVVTGQRAAVATPDKSLKIA